MVTEEERVKPERLGEVPRGHDPPRRVGVVW
jgi:hypothetical protein